jgi:hypothetical protein
MTATESDTSQVGGGAGEVLTGWPAKLLGFT